MRLMRRGELCGGLCKNQLPAHSQSHLLADATTPCLIGRATISTICTGVMILLLVGSIVDERQHATVRNPRHLQPRPSISVSLPYSVTPFYTPPMPSPVIPPDFPPLPSHTQNGQFVYWV